MSKFYIVIIGSLYNITPTAIHVSSSLQDALDFLKGKAVFEPEDDYEDEYEKYQQTPLECFNDYGYIVFRFTDKSTLMEFLDIDVSRCEYFRAFIYPCNGNISDTVKLCIEEHVI
jgi:hypothetical protein